MKVGFIGLGAMGRPMAANLQRAGHEVQAHDLRRVEGFPNWKTSAADAAALRRARLGSISAPIRRSACAACIASSPASTFSMPL
jgi:3-hydroxyisobutyrate dehydrogenase-like beta-hydroxyacid dehydrogenase